MRRAPFAVVALAALLTGCSSALPVPPPEPAPSGAAAYACAAMRGRLPDEVDGETPAATAPWPPFGDRPTPTRSRPRIGIVVIAAIVVVGVMIVALTLGQRNTPVPPTGSVVAPNLVGIPVSRARSVTQDAGLVFGQPVYRQTDAYPEGTVISQTPGPGTPVAAGSTILPTVSTARDLVAVPDVVGSPQSDAIFAITTAGLRVGSTTRAPDPSIPDGSVIATEPAAGRSVAEGTSVAIIVSSGPAGSPAPGASPSATPAASPAPGTSNPPSPSEAPSPTPSDVPGATPGHSPEPSSAPSPSVAPSPS